jgi:predicted metal-binding protein
MKLIDKTNQTNEQIKCGKCACEYFPRMLMKDTPAYITECVVDFSCPQCGFGKLDKNALKEMPNNKSRLLLG